MIEAICADDLAIGEALPTAGLDTYQDTGTGRDNGVADATITFTFTDAGDPGNLDTAKIKIVDIGGNTVLDVTGHLQRGSHQAHS